MDWMKGWLLRAKPPQANRIKFNKKTIELFAKRASGQPCGQFARSQSVASGQSLSFNNKPPIARPSAAEQLVWFLLRSLPRYRLGHRLFVFHSLHSIASLIHKFINSAIELPQRQTALLSFFLLKETKRKEKFTSCCGAGLINEIKEEKPINQTSFS